VHALGQALVTGQVEGCVAVPVPAVGGRARNQQGAHDVVLLGQHGQMEWSLKANVQFQG